MRAVQISTFNLLPAPRKGSEQAIRELDYYVPFRKGTCVPRRADKSAFQTITGGNLTHSFVVSSRLLDSKNSDLVFIS
jgi:hypothetical protein